MMDQRIRAWMTPDPITVDSTNTLSTAFHLMKMNNIRRLPVIDNDGRLVGIITWGDIREGRAKPRVSMTLDDLWEARGLAAIQDVNEFMTKDPVVIGPDASIGSAAQLLLLHKIGGLPVVENGKLVGMLTESDLFRYMVDSVPEPSVK